MIHRADSIRGPAPSYTPTALPGPRIAVLTRASRHPSAVDDARAGPTGGRVCSTAARPIHQIRQAADDSRGIVHWFRSSYAQPVLACGHGPSGGADPPLRCRRLLPAGFSLSPTSTGHCDDQRRASHPARNLSASWRTHGLVHHQDRRSGQVADDPAGDAGQDRVGVPDRPGQQVLQPVQASAARRLADRPSSSRSAGPSTGRSPDPRTWREAPGVRTGQRSWPSPPPAAPGGREGLPPQWRRSCHEVVFAYSSRLRRPSPTPCHRPQPAVTSRTSRTTTAVTSRRRSST